VKALLFDSLDSQHAQYAIGCEDYSAGVREWDAENSQDSANSSISEMVFGSDKPLSNHSIGGGIIVSGSSRCLSQERALKRTGKIGSPQDSHWSSFRKGQSSEFAAWI